MLIADDHEGTRQAIRILLELAGFSIAGEAVDGPEACRLAAHRRPDIVVLDHAMPRMTGGEAADIIRCVVPGARIVCLSSHLGEPPQWADVFLSKNDIGDLGTVIEGLVAAPTS